MVRPPAPWQLPGLKIVQDLVLTDPLWLWSRVSSPPSDIAASISVGGLRAGSVAETDSLRFVHAAAAISEAPNLAATVADRVGCIHVLSGEPGYDISHSEPRWPNRIFVSLPERHDIIGTLRLAESIVHEAMHLHLTYLEVENPLVRDESRQTYSPWRNAPRPIGGVLHGLFVFKCLQAFFETHGALADSNATYYVEKRLHEISVEVAEVDLQDLATGLTSDGNVFLAQLLSERAWNSIEGSTGKYEYSAAGTKDSRVERLK